MSKSINNVKKRPLRRCNNGYWAKQHWNSVYMDGTLEDDLVKRLIGESYDIVFNKLPKKVRTSIDNRI